MNVPGSSAVLYLFSEAFQRSGIACSYMCFHTLTIRNMWRCSVKKELCCIVSVIVFSFSAQFIVASVTARSSSTLLRSCKSLIDSWNKGNITTPSSFDQNEGFLSHIFNFARQHERIKPKISRCGASTDVSTLILICPFKAESIKPRSALYRQLPRAILIDMF